MRMRVFESTRFLLIVAIACGVTYLAGNTLAFAFSCTIGGCNDWAEGACAQHEGLKKSFWENPTCEAFCWDESQQTGDCDDV